MRIAADDPDRDWRAAGVYEVAPGVHRIPLPLPDRGLHSVNVYALAAPEGVVLIDAGQATTEAREHLEDGLAALGLGLPDVREFVVTHVHVDHYTQAVAVRRDVGTEVAIGADEKPSLRLSMDRTRHPMTPHIHLLRRAGATELAQHIERHHESREPGTSCFDWPDRWLEPEEHIAIGEHKLRTIATPGHTRGHLVFADESRSLMFTGDHVLPHITPSIGFEAAPVSRPLADYLHSLHRVRALPDCALLPAHGPIRDSVHRRVDELLTHHEHRLAAIERLVHAGADTPWDVAHQLTWTRRERRLDQLDPFNQMLAVSETMAHMDLLGDQGRVTMVERDGVRQYCAA